MIDLKALGLTPEAEAQIMGAAAAVAATKAAVKVPRKSLTREAWEAAKAGVLPPVPTFPLSNIHAQKKADALHKLAQEADFAALGNTVIGGTNTYAKALREYLAALLHYAQQKQAQEALDFNVAKAATKAKKTPKAAA
jgi:hypothetical protein